MKISTSIAAAVILCILVACNNPTSKSDSVATESSTQNFNLDTTKLKTGEPFYQCEMHPEVLSGKQGSCPKCGMNLIEIKKH